MPPPPRSTATPRAFGLLGVPIHDTTLAHAVQCISGSDSDAQPRFSLTVNTAVIRACESDFELPRILCEASLVLCTDRALSKAAARVGIPLIESFDDAQLLAALFQHAVAQTQRLFLLDDDPARIEKFAADSVAAYPGLRIVGTASPGQGPLLEAHAAELAARIRDSGTDLLIVGIRRPERDRWIAMHYRDLGVPCILGIDLVSPHAESERRQTRGGLRGHLDDFATVWRSLRAHSKACRPFESAVSHRDWEIHTETGILRLIAPSNLEGRVSDLPLSAISGQPRGAVTLLDLEAVERLGPAGLGTLFTLAGACFR